MAKKYAKPVSLYPLKFEEVVSTILQVKPQTKISRKQKATAKHRKSSKGK